MQTSDRHVTPHHMNMRQTKGQGQVLLTGQGHVGERLLPPAVCKSIGLSSVVGQTVHRT